MASTEKGSNKNAPHIARRNARGVMFGVVLCALIFVPLVFSPQVHRYYSIPKLTALLLLSAVLLPLATHVAFADAKGQRLAVLKSRSKRASFLFVYVSAIALSTLLGSAPRASLFGSFENRIGLVAYLCFLTCAVSLILGIDGREKRLRLTAITL